MRYNWKDINTGLEVEVSRSVQNIEHAPDKDEAIEAGMAVEDFAEAKWERLVSQSAFLGPKGKGIWGRI